MHGANKPIASWSVQFERNVGLAAQEAIWQKSAPDIGRIAEICRERNDVVLVCRGTADTVHYREEHHAKNAVIALQRSMVGYNLGMRSGVSPDQILMGVGIIADSGFAFRTLTLEVYERSCAPKDLKGIDGILDEIKDHLADVDDRLENLEQLTKYLLTLKRPQPKALDLSLGLGGASTAFSATPYVQAMLTWKQRFALDFQGGVSPWTSSRTFSAQQFTTRSRFIGVHGTYYLKPNGAIGISGGYERHERLNVDVGEHLQRLEAFVFGLRGRVALSRCFDLTGEAFWLPGERYSYPNAKVSWPTDTFRIGAGITLNLGGRS